MRRACRVPTFCAALLTAALGGGALLAESAVATGRLVATPGAEQQLKAPVSGVIDQFVVGAGRPITEGALLVTYDTRSLEKSLAEAQARYATLAAERRVDGGFGVSRRPELEAREEIVSAQERISHARLLAPEDGWVMRPLVSTGSKVRRKTPLLVFVPLSKVSLTADVPAEQSGSFAPGRRVVVRSAESGEGEITGTVATAGAPTEGGGPFRFEVRLAASPPFALGETLAIAPLPPP